MNLLRTSSKSITRVSQIAFLTRRPEHRLFSTEAPAAQPQHQPQIPLWDLTPTPNLNADDYNSGDPQHQSRRRQPLRLPPTRSYSKLPHSTTTQPPPHHHTATTQHNHRTSTLRHYSQMAPPHPPPAANFDPLHGSLPSGAFIARLTGITKHTSKSDILNLLSNPALGFEDIKHDYSLSFFAPLSVLVRLPSRQAYEVGIKSLTRKGRYKLEKESDASKWHAIKPFDGKYVLMHEIPRNALPADISRFLSGCPHDASSIEIFNRPNRMAIAGFPSQELAKHAFITKNRWLCLNQEIKMQVLY